MSCKDKRGFSKLSTMLEEKLNYSSIFLYEKYYKIILIRQSGQNVCEQNCKTTVM